MNKLKLLSIAPCVSLALGGMVLGGESVLANNHQNSNARVLVEGDTPPGNTQILYVSDMDFGTIPSLTAPDTVRPLPDRSAPWNSVSDPIFRNAHGIMVQTMSAQHRYTITVRKNNPLLPGSTLSMRPVVGPPAGGSVGSGGGTGGGTVTVPGQFTLNSENQTLATNTSGSNGEIILTNPELNVPAGVPRGEYTTSLTWTIVNSL